MRICATVLCNCMLVTRNVPRVDVRKTPKTIPLCLKSFCVFASSGKTTKYVFMFGFATLCFAHCQYVLSLSGAYYVITFHLSAEEGVY